MLASFYHNNTVSTTKIDTKMFELDDSKKESIAFHALQFAKKAPTAAMINELDEQSATDSGQFLRELSEISPQSVANPSLCDGIFVCSNVLEDANASSSRKMHAFALLANMFTDEEVLRRTHLHENKKLAKITIEHLFSLDVRIDRPCLTQVARLLVAAGQKCKSLGYQWGELGDENDEVWWLELLYDEDVQQRLKSIKELGERSSSVDELCGLIGDIELLTVNSPAGTM